VAHPKSMKRWRRNMSARAGRAMNTRDMQKVLHHLRRDPVVKAVYDAKSEEIGPNIYRFKAEIGARAARLRCPCGEPGLGTQHRSHSACALLKILGSSQRCLTKREIAREAHICVLLRRRHIWSRGRCMVPCMETRLQSPGSLAWASAFSGKLG
jgi:hypothetical protein